MLDSIAGLDEAGSKLLREAAYRRSAVLPTADTSLMEKGAHTILERRPARPEDAVTICAWFSNQKDAVLWGGPSVPNPLCSDWLAKQLAEGGHWVWVDQAALLSGVFGLLFPEPDRAHLMRFAIAPSLQGRGLAKILLPEIKSLAASCGAREMQLWVYGSNHAARHVYERAGFIRVKKRTADEDVSGESYLMVATL